MTTRGTHLRFGRGLLVALLLAVAPGLAFLQAYALADMQGCAMGGA